MINKITRESIGEELFNMITEDYFDISYKKHRRDSNFFSRLIFHIDEEHFPEHPELWGFWETPTFIYDEEQGDYSGFDTLIRVEKKTKSVIKEYWETVD